MGIDTEVNAVLEALGMNTAKAADTERQQGAIANDIVSTMQGATPSALAVSAQKNQGDLAAQDNAIAVRQALGNDINDPDSLMAMMVQDFRDQSIAARQQRAEVAELQQVGLFDDPLQYIVNSVMLPDKVNALNATQGKADQAAQTIQNMQSLTTASAQAQRATAQNLTKESVAAASQVQAAELQAKIGALKIDALGYDSSALKLLNEGNQQFLSIRMQQHSLEMQAAAAARASEMHNAQMSKIKEADMDDAQYTQLVNLGRAVQNLPALTGQTIKMLRMGGTPNDKQQLSLAFSEGTTQASLGRTDPTSQSLKTIPVGATPGQAIMNTLAMGGLNDQQNKPSRDYLQGVAKEAREVYETKSGKITKFSPEVASGIGSITDELLYGPVNQKTGKRMETQGKLYKMIKNPDATGSLYKIPDLVDLVKIPGIQTNPLYDLALKPAVDSGLKEASPKQVYAMAAAARDAGKLTDQQLVVAISDLYKTATAATYASKGMGKFGLPYYQSYIAEGGVTIRGMGIGTDTVDWAKPEDVLSYDVAKRAGAVYNSLFDAAAMRGVNMQGVNR